jgi:hypothetical protein
MNHNGRIGGIRSRRAKAGLPPTKWAKDGGGNFCGVFDAQRHHGRLVSVRSYAPLMMRKSRSAPEPSQKRSYDHNPEITFPMRRK